MPYRQCRCTAVICAVCAGTAACQPSRSFAIVNEACVEQMSEVVYHHACQHGRLGPYTPVDAVAISAATVPTVDAAQRVLSVKLSPRELDPDGISYVRYVATRTGQHAVFAGAGAWPVEVAIDRAGIGLPLTAIESVDDPARCGGMRSVVGVELTAGEPYLLAIGPTDEPEIRMFVEHLPTFGEEWSDQCVD
jgi:hypothetical protein